MRNITYMYNVGDVVELKLKHQANLLLPNGEVVFATRVKIEECRDYNGPCYKFEGVHGFYKEACINQRLVVASVNSACRDEAEGGYTLQDPLPSCDTRDSGEPEKDLKWNEAKWVEALFQRGEYHCSKCGGFALHKSDGTENPTSFCPHCGKKMINWEEV